MRVLCQRRKTSSFAANAVTRVLAYVYISPQVPVPRGWHWGPLTAAHVVNWVAGGDHWAWPPHRFRAGCRQATSVVEWSFISSFEVPFKCTNLKNAQVTSSQRSAVAAQPESKACRRPGSPGGQCSPAPSLGSCRCVSSTTAGFLTQGVWAADWLLGKLFLTAIVGIYNSLVAQKASLASSCLAKTLCSDTLACAKLISTGW